MKHLTRSVIGVPKDTRFTRAISCPHTIQMHFCGCDKNCSQSDQLLTLINLRVIAF